MMYILMFKRLVLSVSGYCWIYRVARLEQCIKARRRGLYWVTSYMYIAALTVGSIGTPQGMASLLYGIIIITV